ncbi:hypothetical protein B0H34DRAFT_669698 [Crassisporium funariophilum]|nr:hypothetical protein B0H34DRAFT_669698 [Crassisporium funariophilum]
MTIQEDNNSRVCFTTLPFDIHLAMLRFVIPTDIIALRKTCKAMVQATSQRNVWLDAFNRLCSDNSVLWTSFPISEMSLLELESAAMGPARFTAAIRKAHINRLAVLPSHLIHAPLRSPEFVSVSCKNIFLIPGGRYLVTLYLGYLEIWDLGKPGLREPISQLMTIHRITTSCEYFIVHPSRGGQGVRICVRKPIGYDFDAAELMFQWEIYNIDFTNEAIEIAKIASLTFRRESRRVFFHSVCDDLFVVVDGDVIKVWNFVLDKWASWTVDRHFAEGPRQIIVYKDTVTIVQDWGISIWNIPPMRPNAQACALEPTSSDNSISRSCFIHYKDTNHPYDFRCRGSIHSLWFDLVVGMEAKEYFQRYQIHLSRDPTSSNVLLPMSPFLLRSPPDSFHSPYRICGENAVMWWTTPTSISANIGPTVFEDQKRISYTTTLCNAKDIGRLQSSGEKTIVGVSA